MPFHKTKLLVELRKSSSHLFAPIGELQAKKSCKGHQNAGAHQGQEPLIPQGVLPLRHIVVVGLQLLFAHFWALGGLAVDLRISWFGNDLHLCVCYY